MTHVSVYVFCSGAASDHSLAMTSAPSLAMTSGPSLAMTSAPSLAVNSAPSLAMTSTPSLALVSDSCNQLTLMLRLDSDWIRPVTVTLNNATVSSSKLIGSACHVAEIIDQQTVQLYLPLKCEPEFGGVCGLDSGSGVDIGGSGLDPGNVVDPGSSGLDTGSISLAPGSTIVYSGILDFGTGIGGLDSVRTVVDPGYNITDIESPVADTIDQDTSCDLCDPGKDVHGSGIDLCETGGSVSEPKYDVRDEGCKICDSNGNALRPGSNAQEQLCDLGKYFTTNKSDFHY